MDRRTASELSRWGVRFLIGSAIVVATWAFFEFAPREEPASPGKTPNPSLSPWNQPIPRSEFNLGRVIVALIDTVLPLLAASAFAAGLAMIAVDAGSHPGILRSILGPVLLIGGLSLVATTIWQWHVRTRPMEITMPTTPTEMDPDSPFAQDFSKWTPEKSDAYWKKMRRWDRLDMIWWRLVLYGFPPAGLLFAATGIWLLSARGRRSEARPG